MQQEVGLSNLLPRFGGSFAFDYEQWINSLYEKEHKEFGDSVSVVSKSTSNSPVVSTISLPHDSPSTVTSTETSATTTTIAEVGAS